MAQLKYKRVLLKISGEALAGDKHFGFDFDVVSKVCDVIKKCTDMGVQMGVVIGGGNFWRGVKNGEGYIERTRADHMGMLATAMNCMAVADVLEQKGVDVRVQTALEIKEVAEPYIRARAIRHLEKAQLWPAPRLAYSEKDDNHCQLVPIYLRFFPCTYLSKKITDRRKLTVKSLLS